MLAVSPCPTPWVRRAPAAWPCVVMAVSLATTACSAPGISSTAGPKSQLTVTGVAVFTVTNRQPMSTAISVQLVDSHFKPVSEAGVVINVKDQGVGTMSGVLSRTTDANGLALFDGLLITGRMGTHTLQFQSPGLNDAFATVNLLAGAASTIQQAAGNGGSAKAGTPVTVPPTVRAVDVDGNAVSGVRVSFSITAGGGQIAVATDTTRSDGTASVGMWTLGPAPGTNRISASATGLAGSPITFSATGLGSGLPVKLAMATQPTNQVQSGAVFPTQPIVRVTDETNAAVALAGRIVKVAMTSGAGTLSGATSATTDSTGRATFSGLSIAGSAGAHTLTFSDSGLASVSTVVNIIAGPAGALSLSGGNNQTTTVGKAVSQLPTVRVTDASGNPVSGVPVTWAITGGGGTITGATTTTNQGGLASVGSWVLGPTPGTNSLTATAASLQQSIQFLALATLSAGTMKITASADTVTPGKSVQLSVVVFDQFGDTVKNPVITWSSADPTYLTVTQTGRVDGVIPSDFGYYLPKHVRITAAASRLPITIVDTLSGFRTLEVGWFRMFLEGHVYRCTQVGNGGPLPNARVSTSLDAQAATTDASGHFYIATDTHIRGGGSNFVPYTITVSAPGFRTLADTWPFGDLPTNQSWCLNPGP